ncbi:MAG: type-F conjugative transfer system secretin TraK [Alphaproteobacteria bacterium]|nr:type-F conjugative transfer system secretin TraK [Alphaproteobacteria bacterium]
MTGRITITASIMLLLGLQVAGAAEPPEGAHPVALPAVAAEADPRRSTASAADAVKVAGTMQTITVEPGVNEIIQIAVGHPNRIVTPFKAPRVVTTAAASVETSANVIYVAPSNASLITMFLTETGDESVSISLTLQPKKIPPRELRLQLPPGVLVPVATEPRPKRKAVAERGLVAEASEVFDQLARGSVPADFDFARQAPPPYPLCAAESGFEVSFSSGQYLRGQTQEIYVGLVRNGGKAAATFEEPWCYSVGVIAIALWPKTTLAPGEVTELYLARAVAAPAHADGGRTRPSLLLGGIR